MIELAQRRIGCAALLLCLLGLPVPVSAQPREVKATVVWARADRVYLALPDSTALRAGERVTFLNRGRRIASGEVTRVHEGELAVAKLTSGSLERIRKLNRLRVLAATPLLQALPVLRIGYPARHRVNLVFACGPPAPAAPFARLGYRADAPFEDAGRLVRDPAPVRAPWPDTLLIRMFEDVADEEIALERGDIDLAVFWPGELSTHMREDPRWRGGLSGIRSRGVIAAIWPGRDAAGDTAAAGPADSLDLASLNRELFRGDLAPWPDAASAIGSGPPPRSRGRGEPARFTVDPSWPGRRVVERLLNRGGNPPSEPDDPGAVRVFYLDSPIAAPDSLALGIAGYIETGAFPPELRARADTLAIRIRRFEGAGQARADGWVGRFLGDSLGVSLLFAIRCPLACGQTLRPYVTALGTDAIVDLLDCRPAERRP